MDLIAKKDDPDFRVRMPKPVLRALESEAKRNGRSRNTEIVMRLAQSLGIAEGAPAPVKS